MLPPIKLLNLNSSPITENLNCVVSFGVSNSSAERAIKSTRCHHCGLGDCRIWGQRMWSLGGERGFVKCDLDYERD
jgi:hypothetical protein